MRFVRYLMLLLSERGGTALAVSHDAVLLAVIAAIVGPERAPRTLAFLDGLVLTRHGFVFNGEWYPSLIGTQPGGRS